MYAIRSYYARGNRLGQPSVDAGERAVVADIAGEYHHRQVRELRMISRAAHHRTAWQDLAQHARRTQRQPLRQDVIGSDAALADQKTDVCRQVMNDLHQEA